MAISAAVVEKILVAMHEGQSLKKCFADYCIAAIEFYDFIAADPILANRYARAQQARGELVVDEIIDIADNEHDSQKARNRIDARKWYASKMQPQKYGDRIDMNINQTVDISTALTEAKRRVLPMRDQTDIVDAQVVEPLQLPTHSVTESKSDEPSQPPETRDAMDLSSDDIFS